MKITMKDLTKVCQDAVNKAIKIRRVDESELDACEDCEEEGCEGCEQEV